MKRLRQEFQGLVITPAGVVVALSLVLAVLGLLVGLLLSHVLDTKCHAAMDTGVQWRITHYCGTEAGQ